MFHNGYCHLNENSGKAIVANGYSCRHQIRDTADRKAAYLVSLFDAVG
jgi:hypothetical protein